MTIKFTFENIYQRFNEGRILIACGIHVRGAVFHFGVFVEVEFLHTVEEEIAEVFLHVCVENPTVVEISYPPPCVY